MCSATTAAPSGDLTPGKPEAPQALTGLGEPPGLPFRVSGRFSLAEGNVLADCHQLAPELLGGFARSGHDEVGDVFPTQPQFLDEIEKEIPKRIAHNRIGVGRQKKEHRSATFLVGVAQKRPVWEHFQEIAE